MDYGGFRFTADAHDPSKTCRSERMMQEQTLRIPTLTTERLLLRSLRASDIDDYAAPGAPPIFRS
jgi:hypothetical protein